MATMTHATCRTQGCPENGVDKPMLVALGQDEDVHCGECLQPCELVEKLVDEVQDAAAADVPQDAIVAPAQDQPQDAATS